VQRYGWDQTPEDAITYTITEQEIAQLEAVLEADSVFQLPDESSSAGGPQCEGEGDQILATPNSPS